MSDPIADMLTRIRNTFAARRNHVSMPYSKIKAAIADILQANGYITSYEVTGDTAKTLTLTLSAPINRLDRISKPGRRIYAPSDKIPLALSGRGIVIVSTSNGLMTGREAKQRGLGGELICQVW